MALYLGDPSLPPLNMSNYDNDKTNMTATMAPTTRLSNAKALILWFGFFCIFLIAFLVCWQFAVWQERRRRHPPNGRSIAAEPSRARRSSDCLTRKQVLALPELIFEEKPSESQPNHDVLDLESGDVEDATQATTESDTTEHVSNLPEKPDNVDKPDISRQQRETWSLGTTTCAICLIDFVNGERVRILPRCGHVMHTECLLPWLTERDGKCPVCKCPVLPTPIERHCEDLRRQQECNEHWQRAMRTDSIDDDELLDEELARARIIMDLRGHVSRAGMATGLPDL